MGLITLHEFQTAQGKISKVVAEWEKGTGRESAQPFEN